MGNSKILFTLTYFFKNIQFKICTDVISKNNKIIFIINNNKIIIKNKKIKLIIKLFLHQKCILMHRDVYRISPEYLGQKQSYTFLNFNTL